MLFDSERITYDSHPSISSIVEVRFFFNLHSNEKQNLLFHKVGAVCNNAEIVNGQLRGQPTEGALLVVAMKVNTIIFINHDIVSSFKSDESSTSSSTIST